MPVRVIGGDCHFARSHGWDDGFGEFAVVCEDFALIEKRFHQVGIGVVVLIVADRGGNERIIGQDFVGLYASLGQEEGVEGAVRGSGE